MNLFVYLVYYFFLLFSVVGYGYCFTKLFTKEKKNNLGYLGLFGIFFLILISYFSHLFISHNLYFNSIILLFGLFNFLYYIFRNYQNEKKNIFLLFLLFFLLIPFIFVAKNHDDFPYYHFSYIHLLTNFEAFLGIGIFNHGFRTPSSIFYFSSLFFLPKINYQLIHIAPVFFVGFLNFIFLKKITKVIHEKKNIYILILSILSLCFINIFFARLAEHGTDRSAQILILLLIVELLQMINAKEINNNNKIDRILILITLAVSLKAFYLIYVIFFLVIFYFQKNKINFLFNLFKNKIFYLCSFLIFLLLMINVFNTGCLIYPMPISCIQSFSWSIPIEEVRHMNQWYQQWSKAGAGPNFRVENPEEYIKNFNWITNWFKMYFFNKVSDYLLALLFLTTIFILTLRTQINHIIEKRKFFIIYIFLIFLFIEWFFYHPALRYGGYHLIALLVFIPIAIYLENRMIINSSAVIKIKVFIVIIFSIFLIKNVTRINFEKKKYNYNFFSYPSYNLEFQNFDIFNTIKNIKACTVENNKCLKTNVFINNFYGFDILVRK